jgi:hypothetical protein
MLSPDSPGAAAYEYDRPPFAVIPAHAGIQFLQKVLDARFHGHDKLIGHCEERSGEAILFLRDCLAPFGRSQ